MGGPIDYHGYSDYLRRYDEQVSRAFAAAAGQGSAVAPPGGDAGGPSYLVCFTNRSGSTLLAQALSRCGRMGKPSEIFNPEVLAKAARERGIATMAQYLAWRRAQAAGAGGILGAKVGMHQLAWLAANGHLAREFRGAAFVYVTREDLVMQAVSLFIASASGVWARDKADAEAPAVPFDAAGIARCLRALVRTQAEFEAFFAAHGIEPLRLRYEAIEQDPVKAMRRVCRHVGIERPAEIPAPQLTFKRQRTAVNREYADRFIALNAVALGRGA